jgi:hypothetical protein
VVTRASAGAGLRSHHYAANADASSEIFASALASVGSFRRVFLNPPADAKERRYRYYLDGHLVNAWTHYRYHLDGHLVRILMVSDVSDDEIEIRFVPGYCPLRSRRLR